MRGLGSAEWRARIDGWLAQRGKDLGHLSARDLKSMGRALQLDEAASAELRGLSQAAQQAGLARMESLFERQQQPSDPAAAQALRESPATLGAVGPRPGAGFNTQLEVRGAELEPAGLAPTPAEATLAPADLRAIRDQVLAKAEGLGDRWCALAPELRLALLQDLTPYCREQPGLTVDKADWAPLDPKKKSDHQRLAQLAFEALPSLNTNGDFHTIGPVQFDLEVLRDEQGRMLGAHLSFRQPVASIELDEEARHFNSVAAAKKAGVEVDWAFYVESFSAHLHLELTAPAINVYSSWSWDH